LSVLNERLNQLVIESNLKPAEIARRAGLSKATLSRYLNDDDREPMFSFVIKIANFFNVSSEWLWGATDERRPFRDVSIIDIYEKLTPENKKEVLNYASYLLSKETESKDLDMVAENSEKYDINTNE
jgi:transcriptional regulator with XRE-family HTH domain